MYIYVYYIELVRRSFHDGSPHARARYLYLALFPCFSHHSSLTAPLFCQSGCRKCNYTYVKVNARTSEHGLRDADVKVVEGRRESQTRSCHDLFGADLSSQWKGISSSFFLFLSFFYLFSFLFSLHLMSFLFSYLIIIIDRRLSYPFSTSHSFPFFFCSLFLFFFSFLFCDARERERTTRRGATKRGNRNVVRT